jgi:dTDP-4-dehydrorhamnose reductase
MKISILGASGMLGHTLLYELNKRGFHVTGTVRRVAPLYGLIPPSVFTLLREGIDAHNFETIIRYIEETRPDIIVNCIGIIKQLPEGQQALPCIEINAAFPHKLNAICKQFGCRLIHYSSDCVFDGQKKGAYDEEDPVSAKDYYGITKYLGEIRESPALTIRTSIIGHEIRNKLSLIEWFLAQEGIIQGYTQAIYSGLPTAEHARILSEYIIPNIRLNGIFQIASAPISKYDLLRIIAEKYGKKIIINPDNMVHEEKCLSYTKFEAATGYIPPAWPSLIQLMLSQHLAYTEELS